MESYERMRKDEKELVGAKGVIYLMFLCREVKAYDIVKELDEEELLSKEKGIVSKASVVYQYVSPLEHKGYIKRVEEKPGRGTPKIRTANLRPIFNTIGVSRRQVRGRLFSRQDYSMGESEKENLEFMFKKMREIIRYFPKYLNVRLNEEQRSFRSLRWSETLYYFITFCIDVIDICHTMKETLDVKGEDASEVSDRYGSVKRLYTVRDIVEDAIRKGKILKNDSKAIAEMTEEGYEDIYQRGTFLNRLYLTALGLVNPGAAYFIDKFMEKASVKRLTRPTSESCIHATENRKQL